MKARREKAARQKLEWEEEERQRKERKRIERLETKRQEFLDRQIRIFQRAEQVSAFISFYESAHPLESCPPSFRAFLEWARGYVELLHDHIAPEKLAAVLDAHHLMDDSTDISSWINFER
jgi:hypothetical protein